MGLMLAIQFRSGLPSDVVRARLASAFKEMARKSVLLHREQFPWENDVHEDFRSHYDQFCPLVVALGTNDCVITSFVDEEVSHVGLLVRRDEDEDHVRFVAYHPQGRLTIEVIPLLDIQEPCLVRVKHEGLSAGFFNPRGVMFNDLLGDLESILIKAFMLTDLDERTEDAFIALHHPVEPPEIVQDLVHYHPLLEVLHQEEVPVVIASGDPLAHEGNGRLYLEAVTRLMGGIPEAMPSVDVLACSRTRDDYVSMLVGAWREE